jgi:Leucine-rich repeat (LRR) protein
MKRLPDAIGTLTNLMTLGLGRNQLEFLPASMSGLTSLKYIDVHVNCLETLLPEEIFMEYEKSQEEADALFAFRRRGSGANTTSTPDSTGPATVAKPATPSAPNTPNTPSRRLRRHSSLHANAEAAQMNIVKSSVKLLKGGVVLLAGLRDLECSYNELSELPDMSEMVHFCRLRMPLARHAVIFAIKCLISHECFFLLFVCELQVNLTRVNVAHNSLRDLPEVICDLVGLEKIECGDNRVRRVPESVSKLTRLTLLSLKNNNLRTLPKELGECMALKTLSLNANDLVDLPDHLCNLENLKRLTLAGKHS